MLENIIKPFECNKLNYTYYGALFGFCFPIIATIIWALDHSCSFIEAQTKYGHPLLWIIDSAPLFLGIFASFAGIKQDKIENELELEKEKQMQSAKLAALGEMSSGIVHELNNPLAVIDGTASAIKRKSSIGELDEDTLLKGVEKIISTTERMNKIIKGLRRFSRNSKDDPKEDILISDLFSQTLDFAKIRMKSSDVKFELIIDDDIKINCQSVQLSQVLINLINNSIDAIQELSDKWIRVHCYKIGAEFIIHHYDSGDGITESTLEQIFLPFYTTKEADRGTGLGLSISQKIIKDHNGTLEYAPKDHHTGFKIMLPI